MKSIYKWIFISVIIIVALISYFGIFWTMSLSNIDITWSFEMDDNMKDWLSENEFCVVSQQQPIGSEKPSITFMGDCRYFNATILDVKVE